jgi:hypothetical protein
MLEPVRLLRSATDAGSSVAAPSTRTSWTVRYGERTAAYVAPATTSRGIMARKSRQRTPREARGFGDVVVSGRRRGLRSFDTLDSYV